MGSAVLRELKELLYPAWPLPKLSQASKNLEMGFKKVAKRNPAILIEMTLPKHTCLSQHERIFAK